MRVYVLLRYLGFVLLINSAFLLISAGISALNGDSSFWPLLYSALAASLFGAFPLVFVPATTNLSKEEGLAIVVAGWLLSCLFGTLPFVLWGGEFTFSNAWFESVSGFTTTGSTILTDIEALPRGLLFWRSATHWIGGLGIVLFVLLVLPAMGIANMVLYRSEMSSLAQTTFRRSARKTLRVLATIYLGMTLAETLALKVAGMSLFDAVTHSFATIATGGFSPRNASVAYFDSVVIEIIIMVFMVLSGVHFGLLYSAVVERKAALWRSSAFRYYISILAIAVILTGFFTFGGNWSGWPEALRQSAFQVISIGTSTGFATADSAVWHPLAQILLMLLALQCACAGSTSGGIKADRTVMFAKAVINQLKQLRYPHAVFRARIDGQGVSNDTLFASLVYIGLYLSVVLAGGVVLILLGVDPVSALTGTIATTGNVGPGMGTVGSIGNFAHIPNTGKWVLSATMLFGRLEIYGLLLFFFPALWKAGRSSSKPRF